MKKDIALPGSVIKLIEIKQKFKKDKQMQGQIVCICLGTLNYAIAGENNHVRAKCDKCGLAFME